MATYNGRGHLTAQLESIEWQTRRPDEVLIGDDASTDDTVAIVEAFATGARGLSIDLFRNPRNLGYVKNFETLLSRCRGDIVFFSDQDDVWHRDRIAPPFRSSKPARRRSCFRMRA